MSVLHPTDVRHRRRLFSRVLSPVFLLFASSLCGLCLGGEVRAGLDPELEKPYRVQVVLHVARHRLLTDVFKQQVQRELRDGLRAAFGDLADVEVTDNHPQLQEVLNKGLLQALDAWKEVSEFKTHFLLIDFVDGQYEIQARQYDGLTGQPGPVVRRERVPDRLFVARAAALLVDQDFGLVGTVISDQPEPQTVQVEFKGGKLGVPLERWVKKDEVFALVQVRQGGGVPQAARVPWALLQIQEVPRDGAAPCRLFHRFRNPLAQGGAVLGYRCVKLGTTRAPVRIRLVQEGSKVVDPKANVPVHVRRHGFLNEEESKLQGATDLDGYYSTDRDRDRGTFENVAFVSVLNGPAKEVARIPIPLVDGRTVTIGVNISSDAATQLMLGKEQWEHDVYEGQLVQANLFKDLKQLSEKPELREKSLLRAKQGMEALNGDLDQLTRERARLEEAAKGLGVKLDLSGSDQRLKDLREGQKEITGFIGRQKEILDKETDPNRQKLQRLVSDAQIQERDADFDKALGKYEEALQLHDEIGVPRDPELVKRVTRLQEAWKVKDDKHRQAREFIYDTWPKLDTSGLQKELKQAHEALNFCKAAGDVLSPQKLLKETVAHADRLKEERAKLRPDLNEDERQPAARIAEVAGGLEKLASEIVAYLKQAAPAPK